MSHHKKWTPVEQPGTVTPGAPVLPDGWEEVPAVAVYCRPETGDVIIMGFPDSEGGELHNCDEMGCGSVGPHILARCRVASPDLAPEGGGS